MHQSKPVIDRGGNPIRLCEGLCDRPTHEALKKALVPRRTPWIGRRTNRDYMLTELAQCGQCHNRLYTQTSHDQPPRYVCNARNKGWLSPKDCRPAPLIRMQLLDAYVEEWFLQRFGDGTIFETVYDEGNGVAERMAELRANRERLRADRETGPAVPQPRRRSIRRRPAPCPASNSLHHPAPLGHGRQLGRVAAARDRGLLPQVAKGLAYTWIVPHELGRGAFGLPQFPEGLADAPLRQTVKRVGAQMIF